MTDVSGEWLGTYWQLWMPTRFELTLVQGGNALSGNALDDGYLGEAQVSGEITGRRIQFSKRYLAKPQYTVVYTGVLSESSDFMQGRWRIGWLESGTWEAHRQEEQLLMHLKQRLTKKEPAGVSTRICLPETSVVSAFAQADKANNPRYRSQEPQHELSAAALQQWKEAMAAGRSLAIAAVEEWQLGQRRSFKPQHVKQAWQRLHEQRWLLTAEPA